MLRPIIYCLWTITRTNSFSNIARMTTMLLLICLRTRLAFSSCLMWVFLALWSRRTGVELTSSHATRSNTSRSIRL